MTSRIAGRRSLHHQCTVKVQLSLFILSGLLLCQAAASFVIPKRNTQSSPKISLALFDSKVNANKDTTTGSSSMTNANSRPGISGYGDDAFGLVFLGSSFAAQDSAFAGTFVVLSAIAATATNMKYLDQDPRIPGAVAAAALILQPFVALGVTQTTDSLALPPAVDVGVTLISVAWAFWNWQKEKEPTPSS
jgi:hypothetical protein